MVGFPVRLLAAAHSRVVEQSAHFRITLLRELAPASMPTGVTHAHIQPQEGDERIRIAERVAMERCYQGQ